jgi:hypothetical protein
MIFSNPPYSPFSKGGNRRVLAKGGFERVSEKGIERVIEKLGFGKA